MAIKKSYRSVIVASESPDLYTTKRLREEANALKYQNGWLNPYQFLIPEKRGPVIKEDQSNLYFHRTSGIRYDDFDLLVSGYHAQLGYKITNPIDALEIFRSKDRQSMFFDQHQLPKIATISYRGDLNEKYWDTIAALSSDHKYIIKMIRGNQGIGVNLVCGLQSLKSFLETFHAMKDQRFIIQPYVEHKREWRLFIIENEIIAIIERKLGANDFRGNSRRSTGKCVKKISSEIQNEAISAAELSGLNYCGIDIIDDGEKFAFLEINPVPGFEQIETLSKINIAKELLVRL